LWGSRTRRNAAEEGEGGVSAGSLVAKGTISGEVLRNDEDCAPNAETNLILVRCDVAAKHL
jgi:hypothetical protein